MPNNEVISIKSSENNEQTGKLSKVTNKLLDLFKSIFPLKETKVEFNDDFFKKRISRRYLIDSNQYDYKYITFTFSFIAIAAKLMICDAPLNREEINEYIAIFSVNKQHHNKLLKSLNDAIVDDTNWEDYLAKILALFPKQVELYQELLQNLIKLSLSDHKLTKQESSMLKEIAYTLGLSDKDFINYLKLYLLGPQENLKSNQYNIFGIDKNFTIEDLNKSYRSLVKKFHPDNWSGDNSLAIEYKNIMTEHFLLINKSYNTLKDLVLS